MEFFDVVDENKKLLCYTKQRGMKLEENEYNGAIENKYGTESDCIKIKNNILYMHRGFYVRNTKF